MTIPLSSRLTKLSSEKIAQVQAVYDFISSDLQAKADEFIGARLDPLRPFLTTLDTKNVAVALRASLLLWTVTGSLKLPRQMQLESVLSVGARRDSLVNAGTGSGKTLCLVLPVLLDPENVSLIISPLKRLQILQVVEFEEYGIEACCVNSDTKDDADLWKKITTGYFPVLIVSPESLDNFDGHVPRFARHLKAERRFSKSIPAHRPAWGNLAALRIHLDKGTPVQGFSGTLPPHIIKFIIGNLNFREDHDIITFTANRANITFATRPIVGSLNDLRNLDCVVPIQCKTIIFFDDRTLAAAATTYLDDHPSLSDSDRGRHVVREYHGTMSPTYLTQVFKAFKDPEGGVRILCATSGCATGIDISDIACVIQYGICQDIPNWRQRGGRAGRADDVEALFLTMYEPWAKTIDLSHATGPRADPDEPLMRVTSKKPSKRQRTGFAMLEVIQSEECLRALCATYLDDQTTSRKTPCVNCLPIGANCHNLPQLEAFWAITVVIVAIGEPPQILWQ